MPSHLALALCCAFVAFLLRLDRRQSAGVSRVVWIPTAWMLCCAARPVAAWFAPETASDAEEGSTLDRNILVFFIVIGVVILAKRKLAWASFFQANRWFLWLIIYMGVSVLWSDSVFISFKRYVREWGTIVMALIVVTEADPPLALEAVIRRTAYLLVPLSVLVVKYFPRFGMEYEPWSGERMWVGVTTQKNGLGRLCLVSAFFLVWTLIKKRQRKEAFARFEMISTGLVLAMTFWLFRGPGTAYSATSTGTFILGCGLLIWLMRLRRRQEFAGIKLLYPLAFLILAYGIALPYIGGAGVSVLTSTMNRDATFTGRTEVWDALIPLVEHNPIFGVGYGGFWVGQPIRIPVNEAHNGYLDLSLQLGAVGLILVFGVVVSFLNQARKVLARDFFLGSLGISFLLMLLLHNVSESSLARGTTQLWATFVFLQILFSSSAYSGDASEPGDLADETQETENGPPMADEPAGVRPNLYQHLG